MPDFLETKPSPELYIRWTQVGTFTSHMRYHGTTPREPWEYLSISDIARQWLRLRYALLPYLLTQAEECCRSGYPMFRSLVIEWPDDATVWGVSDEYMLGDSFLVCPVLNSAGERDVYLPTARWVDFWNGGIITSPQQLQQVNSSVVRFLEEASKLGHVHVLVWPDEVARALEGKTPNLYPDCREEGVIRRRSRGYRTTIQIQERTTGNEKRELRRHCCRNQGIRRPDLALPRRGGSALRKKGMTRTRAITGMPPVVLLLETSTEYGRGLLRGIVRYSRLHGPWSLYEAPGHLDQSLRKAKSWSGTGIIARMRSPEMAKQIRATGLPFVASSLDEFRWPRRRDKFGEIRTNSVAIGQMAAAHLVERSLRHCAFCGFHGCAWSSCREEVFSRCLNEQGFECHRHRIELGNCMHLRNWIEEWEHEQRVLLDWLKSLPKPVGVMACNDSCGREVPQACASAELHVPDDVAVVGVDNDELMCESSIPPLSSIALDAEKAGYEAARLLDRLMSGHLAGDNVVQVEPAYVVTRQSSDFIPHFHFELHLRILVCSSQYLCGFGRDEDPPEVSTEWVRYKINPFSSPSTPLSRSISKVPASLPTAA